MEIDGTIHKPVTKRDRERLNSGVEISREIILRARADPKTLYTTKVRAAHPGGTAGIGRIINKDQETEISRLFISDASALPSSPGAPPVLTILASQKGFSKKLISEYL